MELGWVYFLLFFLALLVVALLIRISMFNCQLDQVNNFIADAVTQNEMKAYVASHLPK